MRLFRFLVLLFLVGIVGWLVVRSVTVESTAEKVQITIDKQKLRDAGYDLEEKGREAADKVGDALEVAGKKLDHGRERQEARN